MSRLDNDVDTLLGKLYVLQESVGGDTLQQAQKKKASASKGKNGRADRFEDVKNDMVERLKNIRQLMTAAADVEKQATSNPKEIIEQQSEIRENIRQLTENWREIDGIYRVEARKKKSKFSPEELERQKTITFQLQEEITKVKEIQRSNYAKNNTTATPDPSHTNRAIVSMEDATLFVGGKHSDPNNTILGGEDVEVSRTHGVEMTAGQAEKVQELKARDHEFDKQIDGIGRGIMDLQDYAMAQNEEVKRQNVMLDSLSNKIENVHEHVYNVNSKMKDTLDTVGRKGDKFCVDIICLVLTIGFAAVIYSIYKQNK